MTNKDERDDLVWKHGYLAGQLEERHACALKLMRRPRWRARLTRWLRRG